MAADASPGAGLPRKPEGELPSIEERLAQLAVREGDVVLNKYRLTGLLAASATGAIFLAHHVDLGHEVAVKLLLEPYAHEPEVRARFAREARLMGRIDSDHVARVIDVGELADGTPLIAMESLRGIDLRQLIRENPGGVAPTRAADLVLEACLGLAAAHARQIVHRDMKPSNLFLAERDDGTQVVKVIDFGIAKMRAGSASLCDALTNPSALVGSPRYMAPEQITSSRDVDARADVWALGAILYELIAGRAAFPDSGVANVLRRIVSGSPALLVDVAPATPPGLARVVERALTKDRADRFGSVAELANALVPFASSSGAQQAARVARVLGGPVPPSGPELLAVEPPPSSSGSRPRPPEARPTTITETMFAAADAEPEPVATPARSTTPSVHRAKPRSPSDPDDAAATRPRNVTATVTAVRAADAAPVALLAPVAPPSIRLVHKRRANPTAVIAAAGGVFFLLMILVLVLVSRNATTAGNGSKAAAPTAPR